MVNPTHRAERFGAPARTGAEVVFQALGAVRVCALARTGAKLVTSTLGAEQEQLRLVSTCLDVLSFSQTGIFALYARASVVKVAELPPNHIFQQILSFFDIGLSYTLVQCFQTKLHLQDWWQ